MGKEAVHIHSPLVGTLVRSIWMASMTQTSLQRNLLIAAFTPHMKTGRLLPGCNTPRNARYTARWFGERREYRQISMLYYTGVQRTRSLKATRLTVGPPSLFIPKPRGVSGWTASQCFGRPLEQGAMGELGSLNQANLN